jgi:hypothetical protein
MQKKLKIMTINKFRKIIAISGLAMVYCSSAFAQKPDNFSEKNLTDKSPNKSQILKTSEENPISAIKGIANSVESIMLSKKPTSLMFDDEQNSNIERAIDAFKNIGSGESSKNSDSDEFSDSATNSASKQFEINEKSRIFLGSILYLNPKDWAVWIGGQKITSTSNSKNNEIYLKVVEKDRTKILWTLSVSKWKILSGKQSEESAPKINAKGQVEVEFELKPNQTFILSSGVISEGRITIQKSPVKNVAKDEKNSPATSGSNRDSAPADIVKTN